MQNFFVKGTVRLRDDDPASPIVSLVLTEPFEECMVHALGNLKLLAAADRLWSICEKTLRIEKVRLVWCDYAHEWIATTKREGKEVCDHMMSKPVYKSIVHDGSRMLFIKGA